MPNDPRLAIPFALLAAAAGFAALEAAHYADSADRVRSRAWLLASAVAMAVSTWCTHFIGLTVLSGNVSGFEFLVAAALAVLVVLFTAGMASRRHSRSAAPLIGGGLFGSALSGMHGTGMSGVRLAGILGHDEEVLIVSVSVAIAMAILALGLVLRVRAGGRARSQAMEAAAVAERALHESEARFRQIAEHIEEVFYVADGSARQLLYLSPAYVKVFGSRPRATPRPRDLTKVHPDDRARVDSMLDRAAAGEIIDDTYRVAHADGSNRWVRERMYPVPATDSESPRVVGVFEDVTAKHHAQEQLARLNVQLEERVVARTDELAAANRALEEQGRRALEASRLKSEFLANMSHELRTPLNAIIGFAELMHDGKVGPVSELQQEYLGDVLTSARHLLQLINDVLDLSKIEAGKMEFRPEQVELGRLMAEVRDILRTVAARKRIQVAVEMEPLPGPVVVDPSRLKQVLYNYLSNALKFTSEEGAVTIRVVPADRDSFRLEVRDTGIGISEANIGRLFGEFQQLDSGDSRSYGGTGLGLALTKRIVEAQGGEVGVTSTPGVGSTFHAVLPRQAPNARISQSADGASLTASPFSAPFSTPLLPLESTHSDRRVLIVEDEPGDSEWLVRTLDSAGYTTYVAPTGEAAIAACAMERFDAVVLDLLLPDMSGWDVLRAIRADERNGNVPVLVSTVVKERASSIGFTIHDYFVKPVQATDLLASLERAGVSPERVDPVLVVDDDQMALKLMYTMLTQLGFQPVCVDSGERGLKVAEEIRPSAIVLDLLMPGLDGFEFLERFRRMEIGKLTPVIVWTNKDLTQADLERLRVSATMLATKSDNGSSQVVQELKRHLLHRQLTPLPELSRPTPPKPAATEDE